MFVDLNLIFHFACMYLIWHIIFQLTNYVQSAHLSVKQEK